MDSTNGSRPLAVVTGASSGIGLELAKLFSRDGHDLVIAAEDAELDPARAELEGLGVRVQSVQVDLAMPDGVEELTARVEADSRPLDALALNAGVGRGGLFVDTPLDEHLRLVDLNVRSYVHLAHRLLPAMVERGAGKVLFTSSIASTQPGPYQSTYNASKSFVQSLALALRSELKDSGVTVTSLMPGPTETEFFERAGMQDTKVGADPTDGPEDVARDGFEALMAGKERVVSHSLS